MKEPIPIATKPPALLTQLAKSALLGPHLSLWPYRHFLSHLLGVLTFLSLLGRAFLSGPVHGRPTGPEQQRASTNEGRSTVSWIRVKSSGLEHRLHHPIHHPPPQSPGNPMVSRQHAFCHQKRNSFARMRQKGTDAAILSGIRTSFLAHTLHELPKFIDLESVTPMLKMYSMRVPNK